MSVHLGILIGVWSVAFSGTGWVIPTNTPGSTLWETLLYCTLRIALGVPVLLVYRMLAKQLMHLVLPRIIELTSKCGVDFSRRHYIASQFAVFSFYDENVLLTG